MPTCTLKLIYFQKGHTDLKFFFDVTKWLKLEHIFKFCCLLTIYMNCTDWLIIEVHTKIQIALFCLIRLWDVLNEEVIDENHISNNFFLLPWTSSTNDTIYHSWYTKHMHLIILFSLLSINFYFFLISSSMLVCGYWRLQVFNTKIIISLCIRIGSYWISW